MKRWKRWKDQVVHPITYYKKWKAFLILFYTYCTSRNEMILNYSIIHHKALRKIITLSIWMKINSEIYFIYKEIPI